MNISAVLGQVARKSRWDSIARHRLGDAGKPRSASSMLGATTSPKVMVPYPSRAVSQASQAAGTTLRGIPSGISPPYFLLNCSRSAAWGQRPSPLMVTTLSVPASYRTMGATPAKLVSWGRVTFRAMPEATPASTALPPCSRIR